MLLIIPGALRSGSTNRKLAREAARLYGGPVVEADLNLPLYDGDVEDRDGIPEAVRKLAEQIEAAEAVVISTPGTGLPPGSWTCTRTLCVGSGMSIETDSVKVMSGLVSIQ